MYFSLIFFLYTILFIYYHPRGANIGINIILIIINKLIENKKKLNIKDTNFIIINLKNKISITTKCKIQKLRKYLNLEKWLNNNKIRELHIYQCNISTYSNRYWLQEKFDESFQRVFK